jgi:hypothetical protein
VGGGAYLSDCTVAECCHLGVSSELVFALCMFDSQPNLEHDNEFRAKVMGGCGPNAITLVFTSAEDWVRVSMASQGHLPYSYFHTYQVPGTVVEAYRGSPFPHFLLCNTATCSGRQRFRLGKNCGDVYGGFHDFD